MNKEKVLIYDSITDGHHPDYLFHLLNYLNAHPQFEVFVASGESFFNDYLKHPIRNEIEWKNHIHFLPISSNKITELHQGTISQRSFKEFRYFSKLGEKHQVQHGILMYIDYLQLGIAFGPKPNFSISGILFRPTLHIKFNGLLKNLKKTSKSLLIKYILKKPYVSKIHVLDPNVSNFWPNQKKIQYLNEPVSAFRVPKTKIKSFRADHNILDNQKIFLNFGHLDDRKGIEQFLKACRLLPQNEASSVCLILAGNISATYQKHIEKQIQQTPHIRVITFFKYLDQSEYQILFEACDFVLMLYQKHLGMSSVIVRAAAVNKPILIEDYGTLSGITDKYQLGRKVKSNQSEKFKNILREVLQKGIPFDIEKQNTFAQNNTPQAFAKKLLP